FLLKAAENLHYQFTTPKCTTGSRAATRSSCTYQQSRRSSQNGPREIGKHLRPILGYLIGRRRGTVFRKQTAQGVDWLQNRRIAALREHRIDPRPHERGGRYAFFLSERDQLRLFLRVQRQDDRHKVFSPPNFTWNAPP